jgi:hypothetical protein
MSRIARFAPIILLLAAGSARAQGIHEGDIALGVDGDRLAVGDGSRDPITGALLFDECVFGVLLDANARSTNPGFDTDLDAFPPSDAIGYAHRAALRKWNGTDFGTIPPERMRMSFGPLAGVFTPLADPAEPLDGIYVGVSSGGEFHTHFAFRIELNGLPANGLGSAGVYLAELELRIDSGVYQATEPFWLVFNNGADTAEFDLAIAEARASFGLCGDTPPCPADVNGDGLVLPNDFSAWIAAFNAGSPGCDQNGDGLCLPNDFTAWIQNFNAGCP